MKCSRCDKVMDKPSSGMGSNYSKEQFFCEDCTVVNLDRVMTLKGVPTASVEKSYLGDQVFAKRDGDGIILTTEDGVAVTNCIFLEPEVYAEFLAWQDRYFLDGSARTPSAAEERMRQTLRRLANRCERQVNPAEKTERERVVAWLETKTYGPVSRMIALAIKNGEHLPGGKLPPEEPPVIRGAVCKKAGIPPSLRCPSCQSFDTLGLDAETGDPVKPAPYDTPHRAG